VALPGLAYYLVFFCVPIVVVVVFSLATPVGYGGVALGTSLEAYRRALDPLLLGVLAQTLLLAAAGTAIVLLVGFPTAYAMARHGGRHRYTLLALLVVPFWTSSLLRTFAWLIILSPDWFLVRAAQRVLPGLDPLGSSGAVLLVIVYTYLPLAILPVYASLERMDWRLVEAAEDLGATGWGAFRLVTLPSVRRGVLTSALLVFVPMTGEYVVPQLMGNGKSLLYANLVGQQFLAAQDYPLGAALAVVLLVVVGGGAVAALLALQRVED
jgi:spermidine/putrescine transport system permease protein